MSGWWVVGGSESERTSPREKEAVTRAVLRKGGLAIKGSGGDISVTAVPPVRV